MFDVTVPMLLLRPRVDSSVKEGTVAVFGLGLIGNAIREALKRRELVETFALRPDWFDQSLLIRQIALLETKIPRQGPVEFVWSAGPAGFGANEAQTEAELAVFRAILEMCTRVAKSQSRRYVAFHLISSAGGLFEGQRFVESRTSPSPQRPYGVLKLRQENLLERSSSQLRVRIYRATSVYGHVGVRHRMGLVPTLVANGLRRRPSQIIGHMSTLRDYVWVGDVAGHVAKRVLAWDSSCEPRPRVLASGKPSSLFEIQSLVELVLGRKLYVGYSEDPSNSEDITFSPDLLPADWSPSDLQSNIRAIVKRAVRRGVPWE